MDVKSNQISDAALLLRYADGGEEQAFAELVRRHLSLVYSAAQRRVANPAAAEDVSQAVFIELAKNAAKLARHPLLPGWLYTTASRLAAEICRQEARRQRREQLMELPEETEPSSEIAWAELKPVLDDAMQELSEEDRHGIILRYLQERDFQSVGEALGLSADAARMRVRRAVDQLRGVLKRYGITSTILALETMLAQHPVEAMSAGLALSVTQALHRVSPAVHPWLAISWTKAAAVGAILLVLGGGARSFLKGRRPDSQPAASPASFDGSRSTVSLGQKSVRSILGHPGMNANGALMDPRLAEALEYLKSALFDVSLDKSERIRLLIESAGMLVGQEGETILLFREALASSNPEVTLMAVEGLGRFGELPREFTAELLGLIEEPSSRESAGLIANRLLPGLLAAETPVPTLLAMLERRPDLEVEIGYLLVAIITADPVRIASHREALEKMLESSRPEASSAARKILAQLPEPPPPPDAERSREIAVALRSSENAEKRHALQSVAQLHNITPEIREGLSALMQSDEAPPLRVEARVQLARFMAEPGASNSGKEVRDDGSKGNLAVPDLLQAVADGTGNLPGLLVQLGALDPSYWNAHLAEKNMAAEMLAALHRDKDAKVHEAAAKAYSRLNRQPQSLYTIDELIPFFAAMESALTPGEYAIAMRDLRSTLLTIWKARGFVQKQPSHIPTHLVQILLVGPSHENRAAYDQMLNAMRREVDPAFRAR